MKISGGSLAHTQVTGQTANDHHDEAHAPEDHSGQGATATELETLTDGSDADSLHNHASFGSQATQAEAEAQSNVDKYLPPDLLHFHPGVAKAWCQIASAGTLPGPSYGISSITDNGIGNRTAHFSTAFSSAVYAGSGLQDSAANDVHIKFSSKDAGSHVIILESDAGTPIDKQHSNMWFGDQA